MWQSEIGKMYFDAWLNIGRSLMNGTGRKMPFPENEERSRPDVAQETKDIHVRRFLEMMQRLNAVAEANANISHAWMTLLLTRWSGMLPGSSKDDSASELRKQAIDQLIKAYPILFKEYLNSWSDVWASLSRPQTRQR